MEERAERSNEYHPSIDSNRSSSRRRRIKNALNSRHSTRAVGGGGGGGSRDGCCDVFDLSFDRTVHIRGTGCTALEEKGGGTSCELIIGVELGVSLIYVCRKSCCSSSSGGGGGSGYRSRWWQATRGTFPVSTTRSLHR